MPVRLTTRPKRSLTPTLGLCMLTRDVEATLAPALGSVEGLVDRVVVVDTGSRDATVPLARSFGATVLELPWQNDFSAARNAALDAIATDWVLVLDADEELPREAHAWIRAELRAPRAEAYITPVRNYLRPWEEPQSSHIALPPEERHPRAPDAGFYAPSAVCRLYRRSADVRYSGAVHEQVEYRLYELGRPVGQAGFFIHHFGWYLIGPEALERKRALYLGLLAEKRRARPEDMQVLLQYGDALLHWEGRTDAALKCFLEAAAKKPGDRQVWMHLAEALLKKQQPEAALIALAQAETAAGDAVLPETGKLASQRGEAYAALRRWAEARECFRIALRHFPDSVVLAAKLAVMEIYAGETETGQARMASAIAAAEAEAEQAPTAGLLLRAAELHMQVQAWAEALAWLRRARDAAERERALKLLLEVEKLRARASMASGQFGQAAEAAGEVARLAPSPKTVLRYAALLRQAGEPDRAAAALDRGVALFPDAVALKPQALCADRFAAQADQHAGRPDGS